MNKRYVIWWGCILTMIFIFPSVIWGKTEKQKTQPVDSVKHTWMYNSKQKSFIATQVSGNWNSPGQKGGGVLSHRGSKYLLDHGIAGNCFEILNYYYGYSDKSTGSLLFLIPMETEYQY